MRLFVVMDLHGQASVLGVFDSEAKANEVAQAEPAYRKVEVCELNVLTAPALIAPPRPPRVEPTVIRGAPRIDEPSGLPDLDQALSVEGAIAETIFTLDHVGRARDGERVLVRKLHDDPFSQELVIARLAQSAEQLREVEHAWVARPRWLGTLGGQTTLVWPWPDGATLDQWLTAHPGRTGAHFAIALMRQVLAAAQAVHEVAPEITIIACPTNILVRARHPAQLLQPGIDWALRGTIVERAGVLPLEGSTEYWGAENNRGEHGPRGTVYAAGVTLMFMLLGDLPALTVLRPTSDARARAIQSLRAQRRDVPTELVQIVQIATDPDPALRFADPKQMMSALKKVDFVASKAESERKKVLARIVD